MVYKLLLICIKVRENKLVSPHSMFINSCMVVHRVVVRFFVNKFELYHIA